MFYVSESPPLTSPPLSTDALGTFDNHWQIDAAFSLQLIRTPLLIFNNDLMQVRLSYGSVLSDMRVGLSEHDILLLDILEW